MISMAVSVIIKLTSYGLTYTPSIIVSFRIKKLLTKILYRTEKMIRSKRGSPVLEANRGIGVTLDMCCFN